MSFSIIISLLCFGIIAHAATVTHNFNVSWVTANPDGMQPRPVMGINGQWPIPQITADVGDRIVVNLQNQLGNHTATLHFHGLYQNGTTDMDGVPGSTQCAVGVGESFTYNFTVSFPSNCLRAFRECSCSLGRSTWSVLVPHPRAGLLSRRSKRAAHHQRP